MCVGRVCRSQERWGGALKLVWRGGNVCKLEMCCHEKEKWGWGVL